MGKRLVTFILTVCMMIALLPANGWAADTDYKYEIDDDGTLYVTLNGDLTEAAPWNEKKDEIKVAFVDGSNVTSLSSMFEGYENLQEVYISVDTSRVTDFSKMFFGCKSLTKANLKELDMEAAESFEEMFSGCSSLTNVNVSKWLFGAKQINLEGMFSNCSSIKNLDLSTWKGTDGIYSLVNTFKYCTNLERLNLTGWDFSGITRLNRAFINDSKLSTKLTICNSFNKENSSFAFEGAATVDGSMIYLRYDDEDYKDSAEALSSEASDESHITVWQIPEITADDVTLESDKVIYDKSEKKPKVTVKVNDKKLTEDKDYIVKYYDNVEPSEDAYVKVTGIEDYKGQVEKKFSIVKETNKITVSKSSIHTTISKDDRTLTFTAKSKYDKPTCSSNSKKITASISEKGTVKVKIPANYLGEAVITLTSTDGEMYQKEVREIKVTVGPSGTKITSLKSKMSGELVVNWKKNTTADGFQIRYSADSKMSGAKSVKASGSKKVSKTISGLKDATVYYVQVRTYKTVGKENIYSTWSKTSSVKVAVVTLNKTEMTVYKGSSATIKVNGTKSKVKWSSSNKSVATVSQKGKVKGKKNGTATITAKVGSYKLKCKVTVKTKSGYEKLYDYIMAKGKPNSSGDLIIKDDSGNYGISYNATYNRFEFVYVKDNTGISMNIGRAGSATVSPVYAYSDGVNFCKSSASFTAADYKSTSTVTFTPSVYRGYDVATFNTMANSTLKKSMKNWNALLKKAGTSMKGMGFKKY